MKHPITVWGFILLMLVAWIMAVCFAEPAPTTHILVELPSPTPGVRCWDAPYTSDYVTRHSIACVATNDK